MSKRTWPIAIVLCLLLLALSSLSVASQPQGLARPAKAAGTGPGLIRGLTATPSLTDGALQDELVPANMVQDFEGGWPAPGWSLFDVSTDDGGEHFWGKRDCRPRSGDFAAWAVGGGAKGSTLACGASYPNKAQTWAVYGPFSLRDAISASLTFHMWGKVAPSNAQWPDGLYVGSSTDGQSFLLDAFIGDITGGNEGNGYHRHTMDLGNRLGERRVYVAFGLISDGSDTDIGITIDDITLASAGVTPSFESGWTAAESMKSSSLAWGDVDNDGDLDLAVGNGEYFGGQASCLHENEDGVLSPTPIWCSHEAEPTHAVAWADVDGDGDLDLATGNGCTGEDTCYPVRLYHNDDGILTSSSVWESAELEDTAAIAWGDHDGDGDLDLAAGGRWEEPTRLYRNNGGTLTGTAVWTSNELNYAQSLAWGDVDNDGDLDLAVGNVQLLPNRLYRNDGGTLTTDAVWQSAERDLTYSVAWGDIDGDGDLDLAAGNGSRDGFYLSGIPNRLYLNLDGVLAPSAAWSSDEADWTTSLTLGDVDSDGDLDMAVGNRDSVRLYRNDGGLLSSTATWTSIETNYAEDVAWGDMDNDGDLDLAVANFDQPNRIYRNQTGVIGVRSDWLSTDGNDTLSVAWGDSDGDGDLDLITGNRGTPRLYDNDAGRLSATTTWVSIATEWGHGVAWGDVDGDLDLDLVVGNAGRLEGDANHLYHNRASGLTGGPIWSSVEEEWTNAVAWGDVDNDGDLDLAVGNDGAPNRLYRNYDGTLEASSSWESDEADNSSSLAWGDVDNDGDLDLAVGNGTWQGQQPSRVYRNDGGELTSSPIWSSDETDDTRSVAWGDIDGDGDLDLLAGNRGPNRLYRNDAGVLTPSAVWVSNDADATNAVRWADYDGDGDLDLAVGNYWNEPNRLYRNDDGGLTSNAVWSSIEAEHTSSLAWGDVDRDGDLDLLIGNEKDTLVPGDRPTRRLYANRRDNRLSAGAVPIVALSHPSPTDEADFYSSPVIWTEPTLPIEYVLFHEDSSPVREVRGFYSLNGGDHWFPAVPTADTVTTDLPSRPYPTFSATNTHTYLWDIQSSGVMGQYDNVVFRLVAIPAITRTSNEIAGPYRYGSYATSTFPFRIRGSQVRVVLNGQPVAGALVYRLPTGQTSGGELYSDSTLVPFRTDSQGFLQGHGEIQVGDQLLALAPVSETEAYSLYYTNGTPAASGLDAYEVTAPGQQTLVVSADHPLYLFHLDVSLEWDPHNDEVYLQKLEFDLHRAAEHLYDFSNGQATLGEIFVFQDAENWQTAHLRVYAGNRLRPNATLGGHITETMTDTLVPAITYEPGQIRMPATWNRYGDPSTGGIAEDWPRTLAHEFGHYYLFLDDHYLGYDDQGQVINIDSCTGTAMTDPYRYSEYRDQASWLPDCQDTFANHLTGRSDWQTISLYYPDLVGPDALGDNEGPMLMPYRFSEITVFDPLTPTETIADPTFYFLSEGGQRYQPSDGTRGFLIKDDTWLLDIGEPLIDHILARGAVPGDRVCVFDHAQDRLGCETIEAGDDQMVLFPFPDWQPEIIVSPVATDTIDVTVHAMPSLPLQGRIFSTDGPATAAIAFTETEAGSYTSTCTPVVEGELLLEGSVHIWVDEAEPRRELITDYSIGSSPGSVRGHSGAVRGHSGAVRGHSGAVRGHGGAVRGHSAPILSGDGQITIYTPDPTIPEGEFLTIQAASGVPELPAGRVQIGQAYRVAATPGLVGLTESSLSFQYMGEAVPQGMEDDIAVYHWNENGQVWQPLPTTLNLYNNFASARLPGSGLYALLTAFRVPLYAPGWNLFAYPLRASQPVPDALISIDGAYSTVYGYEAADTDDPWKIYDVTVPDYVNDLDTLRFGQGYWISVTEPISIYFGAGPDSDAQAASLPPHVPSTFYGLVDGAHAGQTLTAWIDDTLCGRSQTIDSAGHVVYAINVLAEEGGPSGCGAAGRKIAFRLDSQGMYPTATWDGRQPWNVPLAVGPSFRLYLPALTGD